MMFLFLCPVASAGTWTARFARGCAEWRGALCRARANDALTPACGTHVYTYISTPPLSLSFSISLSIYIHIHIHIHIYVYILDSKASRERMCGAARCTAPSESRCCARTSLRCAYIYMYIYMCMFILALSFFISLYI